MEVLELPKAKKSNTQCNENNRFQDYLIDTLSNLLKTQPTDATRNQLHPECTRITPECRPIWECERNVDVLLVLWTPRIPLHFHNKTLGVWLWLWLFVQTLLSLVMVAITNKLKGKSPNLQLLYEKEV